MNTAAREFSQALIAVSVALIVGWAGSQHGATVGQVPAMLLCVLLAFAGILNMGLFLKVGSMFIVGATGLSDQGWALPAVMVTL